ncbi:HAD family hydrolase [Calidifontibacter sp. DB0510]|uniref:HAD family hydrolase n=1 Tax=Metallococcus carri TaxID=1656884 RepID=A0A967B0S0_9MICO|nr:HAD family hydrolase [Metallococcus carri]NHN55295.1 HAD family hydrolase [Metallococcus carri]NOP36372.1 HAD family hydrolase [Calidifontibacter sp. DB2511S]
MSTIGFDLDMTLVDSRLGIARCMQSAIRAHGGDATEEELWPLIGIPLRDTLAHFLPAPVLEDAARQYRREYPSIAVPITTALPGAAALVSGLRAGGHRVIVVSAKVADAVRQVLDHVGIPVDEIAGGVFAHDKAAPLRDRATIAYVGDHEGDMIAATDAGALGVGVLTGPHDEARLRAAGARVVIPSLTALGPDPDRWVR